MSLYVFLYNNKIFILEVRLFRLSFTIFEKILLYNRQDLNFNQTKLASYETCA